MTHRFLLLAAFLALPLAADDFPLWGAGQVNVVSQMHGDFHSPYRGANSLDPEQESATSRVVTLYGGLRLSRNDELLVDVETAGGRGVSDALGLAGFSNLDVVRNPSLGSNPYLARLMFHAVVPLGTDEESQEPSYTSVLTRMPVRRVEFRVGKMSTVDIFDINSVGSDSHLQFLNWTIDNNGAFDYAADTRGYTWGGVAEWHERTWTLRAGAFLMPSVANGIHYDHHFRTARGQNLELELRQWRDTVVRLLAYENLARMGNYRESLALGGVPDITATRIEGRRKYGAGVNAEHSFGRARLFGRVGWDDGRNESFAYTEVDRTLQLGGDVAIPHRVRDKAGIALAINRLAPAHRDYLAAGGNGFLLGDGALRYGNETIVEAYYTANVIRGLSFSADVQRIANPGYNRDRGPVWLPGMRMHVDF